MPQDRPLIASVIYNRLAANMPLQIDSTVIYARGIPPTGTVDRAISSSISRRTTPTCTPGSAHADRRGERRVVAGRAAPRTPTYLYYVLAGKDGHHAFSSTFEGQQQNIEAARRAGLL